MTESPTPVTDRDLAAIVDTSPSPYVLVGEGGRIRYVSATIEDLLGYPPDELIGRPIGHIIDPAHWEAANAAYRALRDPERRKSLSGALGLAVRLVDAAGGTVACHLHPVSSSRASEGVLALHIRPGESHTRLGRAIGAMARGEAIEATLQHILDFAGEQTEHSDPVIALGFDGDRFEQLVTNRNRPRHELHDLDIDSARVPPTPWEQVLTGEPSAAGASTDLPEPWREKAIDAGFSACWAFALDRARPHHDVLVVWRSIDGPPEPHLLQHVDRVTQLIQLALEADRHRDRLEHRAATDELTGLANRAGLNARLQALQSDTESQTLGVAYVDIDDFKPVNDRLGHQTGDRVLQVVARRLAATVRAADLAARIGGDEFAALCPNISGDDLGRLAQRIIAALAAPIDLQGQVISISASVGIAVIDPAELAETGPDALLGRADAALLRAKAEGKGQWVGDDCRLPS